MATESESIITKCAKLVRASRTYLLKNVSVDWGVRNDLAEMYRTGTTELKIVLQGPTQLDALYPGNRFIVFGLIEDKDFVIPREVVVAAQRDGFGDVLRFSMPVHLVEDMSAEQSRHGTRLLQTLAARRIIMDLEDYYQTNSSPATKELIIRLGTEYQLASQFTSFVAVDRRTDGETVRAEETSHYVCTVSPIAVVHVLI